MRRGETEETYSSYSTSCYTNFESNGSNFFKKSYKTVFMCFLLILLLFLTTFTFYDSPNVKEPNGQVTYMEYEGMKWFFTHGDEYAPIEL